MKLSKMQITGFGYLNNVVKTDKGNLIVVHLKDHDNPQEDIWLHCSANIEIDDYIKNNLLFELSKGSAILLKFQASYEGFSEVFSSPDNPRERLVIFKAKLEIVEAVYVDGLPKSINIKQNIAV